MEHLEQGLQVLVGVAVQSLWWRKVLFLSSFKIWRWVFFPIKNKRKTHMHHLCTTTKKNMFLFLSNLPRKSLYEVMLFLEALLSSKLYFHKQDIFCIFLKHLLFVYLIEVRMIIIGKGINFVDVSYRTHLWLHITVKWQFYYLSF